MFGEIRKSSKVGVRKFIGSSTEGVSMKSYNIKNVSIMHYQQKYVIFYTPGDMDLLLKITDRIETPPSKKSI